MGEKQAGFPEIDTKMTGERLRRICKEQHISVRDIQQFTHISSNQAVYNWFNGKTLPSVDNFLALSKMTGIPMDDLIIEKQEQGMEWQTREERVDRIYYHMFVPRAVIRLSRYGRLMMQVF